MLQWKILQNLLENTCARVSKIADLRPVILLKFLVHVFPCEVWETFQNTFLSGHVSMNASAISSAISWPGFLQN